MRRADHLKASIVFLAAVGLLGAVVPSVDAVYHGGNGKIAFTRFMNGVGREVWVMNPDGTGPTRLLAGDQPSWSPDGSKIAFGCPYPNYDSVCTAPADGSSVHLVPNNEPYPQADPTWSPDGQRLGITSQPSCGEYCFSSGIWRIDAVDGSDPILMVDEAAQPSWSRNRRIVFTSISTGGIHVVNTTAPGSSSPLTQNDGSAASPDWSPDGERIVFTSERDGNSELYVMNADGSGQTRITNTAATELEPAWSPDGTRIVFARDYNDLYLIDPDGTRETRLTDTPDVQEFEPAWQPVPQSFVRAKSAAPVRVSLVPALERCEAANRMHGPPLAHPSCAPPHPRAGFMRFGAAPTGSSPKSTGHVRLAVRPGTADPGNQADVDIAVQLTDVRRGFDLADGPGSLELHLPIQLTDYFNGAFNSQPATMQEYTLKLPAPCVETADPTVGSTCSASTTANALFPSSESGPVQEGHRAVWQLDQISVYDGGEDGYIESRDDNTVLAVQGIFVP